MKLSLSKLRSLTGFDHRKITARLDCLEFEPGPKQSKLYDSKKALRLLYQMTDTDDLNGEEERARLTHHQANLAEIDEKTKRGELIFEDEVVADIREGMTNFRARILTIPPKVSSLIAGIDDAHEIQAVLEGVCHEALTELSTPYVSMEQSGPGS